jgi:glycosyltransferase involved in cell wall biosynthesis
MIKSSDIIYLGRSRLQRSRANLIQLLHTASGFVQLGWRVLVMLPPWPRRLSVKARLMELDVNPSPALGASHWLHPRWSYRPFIWKYRQNLLSARAVYTRVARISIALARAGLTNHLEVHNVEALRRKHQIEPIIAHHRTGLIRALIPISSGAARSLIRAGAVPERITVAHSGVKLEAYAGLPLFDPAGLDRPRVIHLGRLSQPRGSEIFRHLAARGECEISIISADTGSIPNAVYHPPVPLTEVPAWYARSDLILLPYQPNISTAATMSPIKMFEAMAAGRPIIASDLPTIREILKHEYSALLVEPHDLNAWTIAIDRLRQDRSLAVRLAANARAEANNYSWVNRARGIARAIGL